MRVSDALLRHLSPAVVSGAEVASLFPELSPAAVTRLEHEIRRHVERTRVAYAYTRCRHDSALRAITRLSGADRLPSGSAILLTFHLGPWSSVNAVLRWEGYEGLVISSSRLREGSAMVRREASLEQRAEVAKRAVAHLRAGGRVLIAADGKVGDTGYPVAVLGRRPFIRPGPLVLARLSGAPVLPVTALWQSRHLHVEVHKPLALPAIEDREEFQAQAAAAIGAWIDGHVRAHPAALTPNHVRWLLDSR